MRHRKVGMKMKWLTAVLAVPVMSAWVMVFRATSPVVDRKTVWDREVEGAHIQADQAAVYDASYVRIAYPNGDVPITQGACTDVVVRAMRHAGFDLQKLIHEDILSRLSAYPRAKRPDTNIDHRRVPNQIVFLKKFGMQLTNEVSRSTLKVWHAGDLVYWKLPSGLDHVGIVSDRMGASGNPMVIHNIAGCVEEDCLTGWKIVGHYRYPRG